jgi:integrase
VQEYTLGMHRGKHVLIYRNEDGKRIRTSLGTDDRGLAEARAGQIWAARTAPKSERVEDLWPSYVRERKLAGVVSDRFDPTWKALAPHFGHRLGKAITREDCRAYHAERRLQGRSNSTIKTELEFLRACLKHRYGDSAPALWLPPSSAPRDRYLQQWEIDKLLAAIETPHVRLFVILALTTGARMSALLDLTWDRVDFQRRIIDLNPPGRHKTNKRRTVVPMNQRAGAALLWAYWMRLTDHVIEYGGNPVASVKKAIRMAAARSGIPCSPHVFRHTAAVRMAEADVPMTKIAQYLGHTSVKVTEATYARFSPSYMRDASAALDW